MNAVEDVKRSVWKPRRVMRGESPAGLRPQLLGRDLKGLGTAGDPNHARNSDGESEDEEDWEEDDDE